MLIVPERGPSIPDARGWAISVLQQVGASRECEEHGWMRACHRDRHQYLPFDTSAGEASSEVGKVLDSSVPAGWSRMPFRPTGYFHPADSCGRKPANSCPEAPMPRPSASGRVQSGAHGARFHLLTKKMTDPVTLAEMAAALEQSRDYRVLRRLVPRPEFAASNDEAAKTALLLDVETIGLDSNPRSDHRAWNGQIRVPTGRTDHPSPRYIQLFQPAAGGHPPAVTALTGITDEMVNGHNLDPNRVAALPLSSSLRTMPLSIARSWSVTVRRLSIKLGRVRSVRLNGAVMASKAHGCRIC